MITSPHSDPRYKEASAKLSKLQADRYKLRGRLDAARLAEAKGAKPAISAGAARLLGLKDAETESSASLFARLNETEEALKHQQEAVTNLQNEISREICAKAKPKHDALAADLAKALKAVQAADQALGEFDVAMGNAGVWSVFPNFRFLEGNVLGWLTRYKQYVA